MATSLLSQMIAKRNPRHIARIGVAAVSAFGALVIAAQANTHGLLTGEFGQTRAEKRIREDWGDPEWTLNLLATPAEEKLRAGMRSAQVGKRTDASPLFDPGAPVTLKSAATRTYALLLLDDHIRTEKPQGFDARSEIVDAVEAAAHETGVAPSYLLTTAKRESGLTQFAHSRVSSAGGWFQFIDQSWLAALKDHGRQFGMGHIADAITRKPGGRLVVADPIVKSAISDLRYNPQIASLIAGAISSDNAKYLGQALHRTVRPNELYAAHLLGPENALTLIQVAQLDPRITGAFLFPRAARANPRIFYSIYGPRTAQEVLARLNYGSIR